MTILTQRELIRDVAKRWRDQYKPLTDEIPDIWEKSSKQIAKELDSLDKEKATAKDVDEIIGSKSWAWHTCDECGRDCEAVVQIGAEPDYGSSTACVCGECLKSAVALLHSESNNLTTL